MYNPSLNNQQLVSGGKEWHGECPVCGKSKFYMNVETGLWKCFSCDDGGNFKKYNKLTKLGIEVNSKELKKKKKITKIVKIKKLKTISLLINEEKDENIIEQLEEIDLPKTFIPIDKVKTPEAYNYILKRGYGKETINKYDLRFSNGNFFFNRIIIPVKMNNVVYGYLGRWIDQRDIQKIDKKYKNSYGVDFKKMLGNYDFIIPDETVIITEGSFSSYRINYNSIYSFGKKLSIEQIILLKKKKVKEVLLLFDNDAQKEIIKTSNMLVDKDIKVRIYLLDSGDPDDLDNSDGKLYKNLINDSEFYRPKFFVPKYIEHFNIKKDKDKKVKDLSFINLKNI